MSGDNECPICNKNVLSRSEAKQYPFCSRRCQLVDLGKWLDEDYSIAGHPEDSFENEQ